MFAYCEWMMTHLHFSLLGLKGAPFLCFLIFLHFIIYTSTEFMCASEYQFQHWYEFLKKKRLRIISLFLNRYSTCYFDNIHVYFIKTIRWVYSIEVIFTEITNFLYFWWPWYPEPREDPTSANDCPPELSREARRCIHEGWWSPYVNPTDGHTLAGFSVLGPKIPQDNHFPAALESMTFQVEFNHLTTNTWLKNKIK